MPRNLSDIVFVENGKVDVEHLNALYVLIGWDSQGRRTQAETTEMLARSAYYISACTSGGVLVGFSRVCGDPYVVQVLDVITHPAHRNRGIATRCMEGVLTHVDQARYVSVTLTASTALFPFYERFGFHTSRDQSLRWKPDRRTLRD